MAQDWDEFMDRLADRFRGSVELIANQQDHRYLNAVKEVLEATGRPLLDIGSGRGEWLGILNRHELAAGVELNRIPV